jgi:topoisomerase-4 subunit A
MPLNVIEIGKRSRPTRNMRLLNEDEVVDVQVLTGNSNVMVVTSNGNVTYFNENELTILGSKAGGVKSVAGLGKNFAVALIAFDEEEKSKVSLFTDKGHYRVFDNLHVNFTARLGKVTNVMPCFKSDIHHVVSAFKIDTKQDLLKINLFLNDNSYFFFDMDDFSLQDLAKYAKKNIDIPSKALVENVFDGVIDVVNKNTVSHPVIVKEKPVIVSSEEVQQIEQEAENNEPKKEEKEGFEQISIFDDLDD